MSNIMPIRASEPASAFAPGQRAAALPRLMDMLVDPSPERMAQQLQNFRASVQESLAVSSKAYRLLSELEDAGLAECAPCTEQLRQALVNNPHFVVLKKLEEAERLLSGLGSVAKSAR